MILKLFHKVVRQRMPPNSFYEPGISLIPKLNNTIENKIIEKIS
jgi:hypothetical protein